MGEWHEICQEHIQVIFRPKLKGNEWKYILLKENEAYFRAIKTVCIFILF